jgi:hypothetical protein
MVSLGTGVAFLYSAFATIAPGNGKQVYFDAVLLILGFLLLGKTLEARAKRRALAALDSLSRMRPSTARRIVDGMETVVPLEEIGVGDDVKVLPGERFPVDAEIFEGRTTVDESMLTGESTPVVRERGDRVYAGSLNYDGAVVCRAHSLGEDTVAGADCSHGRAGTELSRSDGAARRPRQFDFCAHRDRACSCHVRDLGACHALSRNGACQFGRRPRDCLPLCDGARDSCCPHGCGRTWSATRRALQGWRID